MTRMVVVAVVMERWRWWKMAQVMTIASCGVIVVVKKCVVIVAVEHDRKMER